jgi:hypothetical protein
MAWCQGENSVFRAPPLSLTFDVMSKRPPIQSRIKARLTAGAFASLTLSLAVLTSSGGPEPLGASPLWPWLLTGLQVLALWASGSDRWWGWLFGAAVQPVWIAYAVVTGQLGFLPGCAVSAWVQLQAFLRQSRPPAVPVEAEEVPAYAFG